MRRIGCREERWAADPGFLTTEWSDDEGLLWGGKVEQQAQGWYEEALLIIGLLSTKWWALKGRYL